MAIDTIPVSLSTTAALKTVLDSSLARALFQFIAGRRIADRTSLIADKHAAEGIDTDSRLKALEQADLIASASDGDKFYVTAKGLKVARDLERLKLE